MVLGNVAGKARPGPGAAWPSSHRAGLPAVPRMTISSRVRSRAPVGPRIGDPVAETSRIHYCRRAPHARIRLWPASIMPTRRCSPPRRSVSVRKSPHGAPSAETITVIRTPSSGQAWWAAPGAASGVSRGEHKGLKPWNTTFAGSVRTPRLELPALALADGCGIRRVRRRRAASRSELTLADPSICAIATSAPSCRRAARGVEAEPAKVDFGTK